jgi:peroxiredoxin 6
LRVIDALQIACKHPVEMPVDWHPGDKCMSKPTLSSDEIKKQLPQGVENINVPSGKNYLRLTQVS